MLLEDVPGVGKTALAGAIAKCTDCCFGRIQFTPDTLPGDITGMSVYNMKTGEFEHRDGVIMNHILLGDEINRTSPKTQSSLLEYMEGIIEQTRGEERFRMGASPRAFLSFIRASQGAACLQGKDYVKPDDVRYVADSVLAHRLSLSSEAQIRRESVSAILKSLILKVKVPVV